MNSYYSHPFNKFLIYSIKSVNYLISICKAYLLTMVGFHSIADLSMKASLVKEKSLGKFLRESLSEYTET